MTADKDAPQKMKPRPLPTAPATPSQRPNTPVNSPRLPQSSPGISPSQFYNSSNPPPLPARNKAPGSAHTSYIPPSQSRANDPHPPGYIDDYREPQLVQSETIGGAPDVHIETPETWDQITSSQWRGNSSGWDVPQSGDWTTGLRNYREAIAVNVSIQGRVDYEEVNWWNPTVCDEAKRPGPGILPPALYEELHDSDHSLYNVTVREPEAISQTSSPPSRANSLQQPSNSSPALPVERLPRSLPPRPTDQELLTAVPHPNAYYCPRDNCWVILQWKSSSVPPPFASSFFQRMQSLPANPHGEGPCRHIPKKDLRMSISNCMEDSSAGTRLNKTHHFHKYPLAVDSLKLSPPFRPNVWDAPETLKKRRRVGALVVQEDVTAEHDRRRTEASDGPEEDDDSEGLLMDLYMCCQCQLYVVSSGNIPSVVPDLVWTEFLRDKKANPTVGKSPELTAVIALETILTILENPFWKGQTKQLRVSSPTFQRKIGWLDNTRRLFESLGFTEEKGDGGQLLRPPALDTHTPQGRLNRARFLRAWVEIGSFMANYIKVNRSKIDPKDLRHTLWVELDPCRELYQNAIGAHPDHIPRLQFSEPVLTALISCDKELTKFGLTVSTFSQELLAFAYLAQCRCDPASTATYFTDLSRIVRMLTEAKMNTEDLQELVFSERSRDRFEIEEFAESLSTLGFGVDNSLGIEYDEDVDDAWIENAWKACHRTAWTTFAGNVTEAEAAATRANQALKIIAEARRSVVLRNLHDEWRDRTVMTVDRAYDTLEVMPQTEDELLATIYTMRMEEGTSVQRRRMRDALLAIAEDRDSLRLKALHDTGADPGFIIPPTDPKLPRGLNQLGNTCYLNSLLQYFYTIRDLRDAVLPLSTLDLKSLDDDKLTDDELKKHRVGGRLVTRREIIRSKKFISQLAQLFANMEVDYQPSITPTMELAKLALVTSKDEEEDEVAHTDSSNDTEATLVDDGNAKPRDADQQWTDMDIDITTSPTDKETSHQVPSVDVSKDGTSKPPRKADQDADVEMRPPSDRPLPLPPPARHSDNTTMMFGRQHDVSECMDNCMFQIETALLKFDGKSQGDDTDEPSVVKRLFYGKTRQQIALPPESGQPLRAARQSLHIKEDVFSHLHVNVAEDGIDVYDGLADFFEDTVELGGRKGRMEVTIVEPPRLLQIQLQRVQFDRERGQSYKSQAYVKLSETIYLDRFLNDIPPAKRTKSKMLQRNLRDSRERLRMLLQGKEVSYLTALENTRKALSEHLDLPGVDDQLLQDLKAEQEELQKETDELRQAISQTKSELEVLWNDPSSQKMAYELTSVFIHRGHTPSFGHYFFYSRNLPHKPDEWFMYNDETVQAVSKNEVLKDTTGSTANPYLLVYARQGAELVDTVHRIDSSKMETSAPTA